MMCSVHGRWLRDRGTLAGIALILCTVPSWSGERAATPPLRAPTTATLTITATGFRNRKGHAIIALYASADSWLKSEKALRLATLPIEGADVTARFTDLTPGVYAASAIHDENDNGKLDMRYFPIPHPREGAGVSNDARGRLGPPAWRNATFLIPDSGAAIVITLRY